MPFLFVVLGVKLGVEQRVGTRGGSARSTLIDIDSVIFWWKKIILRLDKI